MNYGQLYRDLRKRGLTYEEITDMTFHQIVNEFEGEKSRGGHHPAFPGKRVTTCTSWDEFYRMQAEIRGGG